VELIHKTLQVRMTHTLAEMRDIQLKIDWAEKHFQNFLNRTRSLPGYRPAVFPAIHARISELTGRC
jgi:hypothetical protein